MKLIEYVAERGKQSKLAKLLGMESSVLVNQWAHEVRQVPAEWCPAIEKATNGAVRCEDLRPDVDWAWRTFVEPSSRSKKKAA